MRTIAHLLRTADPLVDEPIWSPHERLIVRQIVLEHSRMAKPSNAWSRRPFVVTLATLCLVLLAGVTIVPRIWSPAVQAAVRFEVRLAELSPGPGLQQVSVPTPFKWSFNRLLSHRKRYWLSELPFCIIRRLPLQSLALIQALMVMPAVMLRLAELATVTDC